VLFLLLKITHVRNADPLTVLGLDDYGVGNPSFFGVSMATPQDYILAPPTVDVEFAIEPATNYVSSLYSLQLIKKYSGLDNWLPQTVMAMKPKQRENNSLFIEFCFEALRPKQAWKDVSSYLMYVEKLDPISVRDEVFGNLSKHHKAKKPLEKMPGQATLLSDFDAFAQFVQGFYGHSKMPKTKLKRIYDLLNDPGKLHKTMYGHLSGMWENFYQEEWEQRKTVLEKCVNAFKQLPLAGLSTQEVVKKVIGRDLLSTNYEDEFNNIEKIIFIPSPHIGPYALKFIQGTTFQLVFGARLPEGVIGSFDDLSRSDLLTKLSALVDDTRLRIVELLTQHGELSAQALMDALDQSQSSVSRHLIQLHSTGFLEIRREARGKKMYSLNLHRVHSTLGALNEFFKPKNNS
jgi:DNA-binding transcriptional ArsR family regulator